MSDALNTSENPVDAAPTTEATPTVAAPEPPAADADDAPSTEFASALAQHEAAATSATQMERAAIEVKKGQKVKARVVSIGDEHVVFDFGGRSEATAETRGFKKDDGTLKIAVGDTVELFVKEAGDQVVLAAKGGGDRNAAALAQLREAHTAGMPVTGRVTAVNTGGVVVDLSGVRAFCPISQLENGFCADANVHVGKSYEFMITKMGESKRDLVVSRREILRKAEKAQAGQLIASIKEGDERDGRVVKLEGFGAFIDLGGVQGMAHVSELAHGRVNHPSDVLREGETVKVKVLRVEGGEGSKRRIALSVKAMLPDPWTTVTGQFTVGQRVQGTVTRLADFGAFVQIAPGIEGLVHVSESALTRVAHVKDVMAAGDSVEALVLTVEPDKRRVSLSVRQALGGAPAEPRRPRSEAGGESFAGAGAGAGVGGGGRREGRGEGHGGGRPGGSRGGDRGARGGDRGERGDRGGRGPGGDRGGRGGDDWRAFASRDTGPSETPMAIALRKAMEKAKERAQS